MSFAHLHLHSKYSILDGAIHLDKLVERIIELGMDKCALTDHRTISGIVEFYREMRKAELKPILGMEIELSLAPCTIKDNDHKETFHLVLLCDNQIGWSNLKKIATRANLEGFYYKPRIDHQILQEHAEGLVGLSACAKGLISRLVIAKELETAQSQIEAYKGILGGKFFLEIQENGITYNQGTENEISQRDINLAIIELGRKTDTMVVATNDCHYLRQDDAELHDIILAIQTGAKLSDADRFRFDSTSLYFKSEEEMLKDFSYYPEAVHNSGWVAESIGNVEIEIGKMHFPDFKIEEANDYTEFISSRT